MSEAACTSGWVACLYHWQEFAGALLSALIAGTFVLFQVWHGTSDARAQKAAQYSAARASLSFGLNELMQYASQCGALLVKLHQHARGEIIPRGIEVAPLPPIPGAAVASIIDLIRAGPRPVVRMAAKLLSGLQIQHSRIEAILGDLEATAPPTKLVVASNLEEFMIDTAKLHARSAALFPLARFDTDAPPRPVGWDDVATSLRLVGLQEEGMARVFETIQKRKALSHPL